MVRGEKLDLGYGVKKMIERMRIRCSKHVGSGFGFLFSLVFVQVKEEDEERKVN